jgi:hypothetical protein
MCGPQRQQQHLYSEAGVWGEFVDAREPPAADFLEQVRSTPTSIPTRPVPPRTQQIPQHLRQASWVYIRRGVTTPPYAGQYAVLEPGEKTFLIKIGDSEDRVSV